MKYTKSVLLFLFICIFIIGCSKDDNNSEKDTKEDPALDYYAYVITGKVVENKNNNIVLLEITKERGGYKKGDMIYVKYENIALYSLDESEITDYENFYTFLSCEEYNPKIGVELSAQYAHPNDISKMDGYDYLETVTMEYPNGVLDSFEKIVQ